MEYKEKPAAKEPKINSEIEMFRKQLEDIFNLLNNTTERLPITLSNDELRNGLLKFVERLRIEVSKHLEDVEKGDNLIHLKDVITTNLESHKNRIGRKLFKIQNEDYNSADQVEAISVLNEILNCYAPKENLYNIYPTGEIGWKESALYHSQRMLVDDDEALLALTTTLKNVKKAMGSTCYSCFMSYAQPVDKVKGPDRWIQSFLEALQKHLIKAGINAKLGCINVGKGENIEEYMATLPSENHWLILGAESLPYKWFKGTNVRFELELEKFRVPNEGKHIFPAIPILVSGTVLSSMPWHKHRSNIIDFTRNSYAANLKELLHYLTRMPKEKYKKLWEEFDLKYSHYLEPLDAKFVKEINKTEKAIEKDLKEKSEQKKAEIVRNYVASLSKKAEKKTISRS